VEEMRGSVVVLVLALLAGGVSADFMAGVAKIDGSLPIGIPLAGFNHGDRRVPHWPLPEFKKYTTFMTPSTGIMNPTWVKALAVNDGNGDDIVFVTIDAIGADGTLFGDALDRLPSLGINIDPSRIILSASHTHSGPGAVSRQKLWELAPATDLNVKELHEQICDSIAAAIATAVNSKRKAVFGFDSSLLFNITINRRAKLSPYVQEDSIDPNLGVIRVDALNEDGTTQPMATVWNYAMHGTCFGPSNMEASSDIMGGVCDNIEELVDVEGHVAMFINADAGDIDPSSESCAGAPNFAGAPKVAKAVVDTRESIVTDKSPVIEVSSKTIGFGDTNLNITLERLSNCTSGGPLDICSLCKSIGCDVNLHLSSGWVENTPKFTAVAFSANGKTAIAPTLPGEPLLELGNEVREDCKNNGYDMSFLFGYSNNHMGYFATPDEYDIGGYESTLTFWGVDTAGMVRSGCAAAVDEVTKVFKSRQH